MQTIFAYTGLQGIGATLADLPALADGSIPITNNHMFLPIPLNLYALYCMGVGISDVRISSPTLRVPVQPDVYPVDTVAQPGNLPLVQDYRDHPFPIPKLEEIQVATTNTNAAAQQHTVVMALGEALVPWDNRAPIFTVNFTAAIVAQVLKWTSGVITFTQALPAGLYAILGLWIKSATIIAGRLILPLVSNFRPGALGVSAFGQMPWFWGRKAPLGIMGQFYNYAPPSLEILCTAADATQQGKMDIAKIG